MTSIRVIDSIMGTGKTTWAINYMNAHLDQRFIYCTPYNAETERIVEKCVGFVVPREEPTKQADFLRQLKEGKNVAITHELLKRLEVTNLLTQLIQDYGYTLILDEMLEVVEKLHLTERDFRTMEKDGCIALEPNTNRILWIDDKYDGVGYKDFMKIAKTKNVILHDGTAFIWLFPIELIRTFDEMFIMTFMFNGSILSEYLKVYEMEYTVYHVAAGVLCEGQQELSGIKRTLAQRIHIYSDKLNKVGSKVGKRYPLSSTWWKTAKKTERNVVFNNVYNYFQNVCRAQSNQVLWTIVKKSKSGKPTVKGRWKDGFCACNMRATNTFQDRIYLAYLIDVHVDPSIAGWFREQGGNIDPEKYSLSQLLQWVWRSAIRTDNEISLYLPSQRMRDFFTDWLGTGRIA